MYLYYILHGDRDSERGEDIGKGGQEKKIQRRRRKRRRRKRKGSRSSLKLVTCQECIEDHRSPTERVALLIY